KSGRGSALGVFAGGKDWSCAKAGLVSAKIKARTARATFFAEIALKGLTMDYPLFGSTRRGAGAFAKFWDCEPRCRVRAKYNTLGIFCLECRSPTIDLDQAMSVWGQNR